MPVGKLKTQRSKVKTWGFTLIELLVVVSIIAILIGLSVFGLQGARQSSRDSQRKADLEKVRSGLENYKSDCGIYPPAGTGNGNFSFGAALTGSPPPVSCATGNTYIQSAPLDPLNPTMSYVYYRDPTTNQAYQLCASLEQGGVAVSCGTISTCGTQNCNYKVVNP